MRITINGDFVEEETLAFQVNILAIIMERMCFVSHSPTLAPSVHPTITPTIFPTYNPSSNPTESPRLILTSTSSGSRPTLLRGLSSSTTPCEGKECPPASLARVPSVRPTGYPVMDSMYCGTAMHVVIVVDTGCAISKSTSDEIEDQIIQVTRTSDLSLSSYSLIAARGTVCDILLASTNDRTLLETTIKYLHWDNGNGNGVSNNCLVEALEEIKITKRNGGADTSVLVYFAICSTDEICGLIDSDAVDDVVVAANERMNPEEYECITTMNDFGEECAFDGTHPALADQVNECIC